MTLPIGFLSRLMLLGKNGDRRLQNNEEHNHTQEHKIYVVRSITDLRPRAEHKYSIIQSCNWPKDFQDCSQTTYYSELQLDESYTIQSCNWTNRILFRVATRRIVYYSIIQSCNWMNRIQ